MSDWVKTVKEELNKPRAPSLADLLSAYYTARNAGAWSNKAKVGNLKDFSKTINYLTEKGIVTLEDLESYLAAHNELTEAVNTTMKAMSARKKRIGGLASLCRPLPENQAYL